MAVRVKTWIWVVVGIFAVCVLGLIGIAAFGFYFVTHNIQTQEASPAVASTEFESIKTRFTGQKPLIELDERGRLVRTNPDRGTAQNVDPPDQLFVLAFDPDDGRIVKVSIPFWLLRLRMGGHRIDFNGGRLDLEDLKLTVEDLERYGPTLIVDHRMTTGERVLVWSQ